MRDLKLANAWVSFWYFYFEEFKLSVHELVLAGTRSTQSRWPRDHSQDKSSQYNYSAKPEQWPGYGTYREENCKLMWYIVYLYACHPRTWQAKWRRLGHGWDNALFQIELTCLQSRTLLRLGSIYWCRLNVCGCISYRVAAQSIFCASFQLFRTV